MKDSSHLVFQFVAAMLTWMGLDATAYGRLGETMEQCIERYGEVAGKLTPHSNLSGNEACLFAASVGQEDARRHLLIRVEFHKGIACYIRFSGKLNTQEIKAFRDKSVGASPWDGPESVNDRKYYRSKATKSDGEVRYACEFGGGDKKHLEIFTSTYANLLKAEAAKEEKAILSNPNWDPVNAIRPKMPEDKARPDSLGSGSSPLDKF